MVTRFAGAIALAIVLQLTVTITSRLFPGLGGGYGAPLAVGRVSPLSFYSDRAGVVTFEPWILVVNVAVTFLLILPLLPFAKVPSTAAAGFLGGLVAYGIWLVRIDPTLLSQSLYPVEYGGMAHPFALWAILLFGVLVGILLWRRRGPERITWTYGSAQLSRIVAALTGAALLQVLVTWISMLLPARDASFRGIYGAPIPVGESQGLCFTACGPGTFSWPPLIANIVLTAALLFLATPSTRTWSTGIVGVLASVAGCVIFVGTVVLAYSGIRIGFSGLPIPMPAEEHSLPWFLWANLIVWSVVGMALWRRRQTGSLGTAPEPQPR